MRLRRIYAFWEPILVQEDVAVTNGIPRFMQNSIILQTFGVQGYHPCQEAEHIQIPPYVSPRAAASYMLVDAAQEDRDIFAFFRGKMEIHPKNLTGRVYSRWAAFFLVPISVVAWFSFQEKIRCPDFGHAETMMSLHQ